MYDIVMGDKEMLNRIESNLFEVKTFLVGLNKSESECEQTSDVCLQDSMRKNSHTIDRILGLSAQISEIIKGQNK